MPYVHHLKRRIQGRLASSRFWVDKRPVPRSRSAGALGIYRYHQIDFHSCGFLAALAVVHRFSPWTPMEWILETVGPRPSGWCTSKHLIRSLAKFGIAAEYRDRIGWTRMLREFSQSWGVIVTVQPEWYSCDHWTVIRGVTENPPRVFLSNYGWPDKDGGMTWKEFLSIWTRGALICSPK
jgi:predicted alpha/beta hydrolase